MKQKTRQTREPLNVAWKQTYVSNGLLVPGSDGDGSYNPVVVDESIKYGLGRETYNACRHYKFSREYYSPEHKWRKLDTADTKWDHTTSPVPEVDFTPQDCFDWLGFNVGWSVLNWTNFYQRAIEAMTPSMETGFSLGNFIYELREVKDLVLGWGHRRESIVDMASDVSLNWNFGLKPFLGDLWTLARALYFLRDSLAELKAGAGKLQVRRYSEETGLIELERVFNTGTTNHPIQHEEKWWVSNVCRTAVMTYTYQMPDIDEALLNVYSFLDAVGLQLNPAIIWEAMPYSFVLDWFLNVGDFLSQLRKKWIAVSLYIKDFGVSEKITFHYDRRTRHGGKVWSDWETSQDTVCKWYMRRPVKIDDRCFSLSAGTGLTLRKFYLGTLLLRQRL